MSPAVRGNLASQLLWARAHYVTLHCKPLIRGRKINGGWYYRWECTSV